MKLLIIFQNLNLIKILLIFLSQIKFNGIIASADDYFINSNGVYVYDPSKIADAHAFCKAKGESLNFVINEQ